MLPKNNMSFSGGVRKKMDPMATVLSSDTYIFNRIMPFKLKFIA